MSENEFNLLKHLQKSNRPLKIKEIEEQRLLANKLLKLNNDLVQKLWNINLELGKVKPIDEIKALELRKTELEQQLKTEDYSNKIDELTKVIHDLEIEVYGATDVGNSSPYKL